MKNIMKTLMVCALVALAFVMVRSTAIAQVNLGFPLWDFPAFSTQPMQVPTWEDPYNGGDLLIDNFEYWDSPYNHGWRQNEPPYPTYGYGMGYATVFNTVLDLQQGSRVLDVYRPSSVFLLGTPYEKHAIIYTLYTPPSAYNPDGENFIYVDEDHRAVGTNGHILTVVKGVALEPGFYEPIKNNKSEILLNKIDEELRYPDFDCVFPSGDAEKTLETMLVGSTTISSEYTKLVRLMDENSTVQFHYFESIINFDSNFRCRPDGRFPSPVLIYQTSRIPSIDYLRQVDKKVAFSLHILTRTFVLFIM